TKWLKNLNYAGVVLLTSNLVLLSSKTIVSVFLVISIIFITRHFYKKKKSYIGVILSASVAILLFIAIAFTPNIKQRIDEISESNFAVLHQERFTYDTQFSGLTIRLLFWKYAVEIIDQENAWLLGVGTGDSQDELIQMYKKHNLYLGNSIIKDTGYLHYDTHNQFVETFLKIGLLGVLYLLFYLIKDILLAINKKDILFLSFLVIFIFFSLTESTLQSNKGIVFFAFFNSLFLSSYLNKKTAKNIN
ncbi:MAG: O-antigen ligase family protein, partial [Rufibacter sp.]